jgi:tetratricopeptide (TPR) repeat protein
MGAATAFMPPAGRQGVEVMKKSMNLLSVALVLLLGATFGCSKQINFLKARNELNRGVRAFEAANFANAAEHFTTALELDPELLSARTYRASSYMMQYVPGSSSGENLEIAEKALKGFQEVLEIEPQNDLAMSSIASLYYNMEKAAEAKEWNLKLIQAYPNKKEAYYTIGVIDWGQSYKRTQEVRASLGMRQEDPGPIKGNKEREMLVQELGPVQEEALKMFDKAIELDPNYEDAMNYKNLTYRQMAELAPSKEEFERLSGVADEWVQKTLDTRKRMAEASSRDLIRADE